MLPHLSPEEQHLLRLQNFQRLRDQKRREQYLDYRFKKTGYYKITLAIRIFFIVFTCVALYPAAVITSNLKKVTKVEFKTYYTGRHGSKKHPYSEFATQDGYYFPVEKLSDPISGGDSIITYKNVLFKTTGIAKTNGGSVNPVSGPIPGLAGLFVISLFSILSFERRWRSTLLINLIVAAGSLFMFWYYVEYLISF